MRIPLLAAALAAAPLAAQRVPVASDSALVGRILLAEDQRDSANAALREGLASGDARVQLLARRAIARMRDPRFAARDSFPTPAPAPKYDEPAWRLRWRAVLANRADCPKMREALADSAWHVRLRAADSVNVVCSMDTTIMRTLREWVTKVPENSSRPKGGVSWHAAAHALLALARISPDDARKAIPSLITHASPFLRTYVARAARMLEDQATLKTLARDRDDNVKEAAVDGLSRLAGHDADDIYLATLGARGYQAVRAAARALKGSPRGPDVLRAATAAAIRVQRDSSETSRDARTALRDRIAEYGDAQEADRVTTMQPLAATLPPDAVALALGKDVRLKVTMADFSGGGEFVVRLRGDVAPIMAARVLAMAKSGYYNGLSWHRVEPDFVVQGGGKGANEYVGYKRFFRDELGTLSHARGTVGMSTRGHDTGDGQWFFNLRDNARLTRDYTVFAEVVSGIDVIDGIMEGDVIARLSVIP